MIRIYKKKEQADGGFNGGAIKEKKPIGFPQDGGKLKPYSNLFYWAHAWSENGSTIGLHPHQAFEIMTFVIEGEIKHYDTRNNNWRPLRKGDAQIIRSGNGISHAERLESGAQIFQIWFDPDIKKSIQKPASYDDYKLDMFPSKNENGDLTINYVGENSPIQMDSEATIEEMHLTPGLKNIKQKKDYIISGFLTEGELMIDNNMMKKGDFFLITDSIEEINILEESRLFVVYSPKKLGYTTYAEQNLL